MIVLPSQIVSSGLPLYTATLGFLRVAECMQAFISLTIYFKFSNKRMCECAIVSCVYAAWMQRCRAARCSCSSAYGVEWNQCRNDFVYLHRVCTTIRLPKFHITYSAFGVPKSEFSRSQNVFLPCSLFCQHYRTFEVFDSAKNKR